MTMQAAQAQGGEGRPEIVRSRAAIFGIAGRRALALYLKVTGLVMLMFLIIAWAIDLAQTLEGVLARADDLGRSGSALLAAYLGYRAVDIVTRLFPVACFIGLFAAELYRLFNRETTIMAAAGWSPRQTLLVVAAFACLSGALQGGLERWWRPSAVFAQAELQLGAYGARFSKGALSDKRWLVVNGNVLRARVVRTDEPELRDVELYRGVVSGDLRDVLVARKAEPSGQPGFWRFHDVDLWANLPGGERGEPDREADPDAYAEHPLYLISRYATLDVRLDVLPETLTYFGIPAFYLPQAPLERLAADDNPLKGPDVDAALWRRVVAFFLPGAYALLGASLAPIAGSGRIVSPARIVGLALCGYFALVVTKVSWAMGEIGALSGFTSSWIALVFALVGTFAAQVALSRPH
ncbi:LptF/LptG family permease [Stappia sp. ES.058]|uniref:LptF/LptG family permease n=1 Tax=Stappia sp. ES.058 TaxID=1881061 RepID=UPI00087DBF22|nr:LptF/LptG family permease [Stappia sp. ES.058]SDU33732.1 Lipopolysaccharide export LptBFGC system, permease protein LptF [Stappia sp. ES.058]